MEHFKKELFNQWNCKTNRIMDYGDTGGEWDAPMGKNQGTPKEGVFLGIKEITYDVNPKDDNDVFEGNTNLLNEIKE